MTHNDTYLKLKEIGNIIEMSQNHYLVTVVNIAKLGSYLHIWTGVLADTNGVVCNRLKNENKINEIYDAIKDGTLASSIMSASEFVNKNNRPNKILCWDGQHRYWALRKYYKKNNINYSGNIYLLVYRHDTKTQMAQRFKNINKCTPAQSMYSSNTIKNTVDAVTGCILKKFPSLDRPSGKPNKPHYNINNVHIDLTQMLENLDKKYINTILIHKCIDMIDIINANIKQIYDNKYIHKLKEKWLISAEIANCFLFLEHNFITLLEEQIIKN